MEWLRSSQRTHLMVSLTMLSMALFTGVSGMWVSSTCAAIGSALVAALKSTCEYAPFPVIAVVET